MMSENPQADGQTTSGAQFGARLQAARKELGLESKDAAAQLRLNERIIKLIENDCYATDLHPTFLRGYIRAYGKLLQIPEDEIKQAIEPIPASTAIPTPIEPTDEEKFITSDNYSMRIITYVIAITLMTLVGIWWASHSSKRNHTDSSHHIGLAAEPSIALPTADAAAQSETKATDAAKLASKEEPAKAQSNISSETKAESPANSKETASARNDDDEEDD